MPEAPEFQCCFCGPEIAGGEVRPLVFALADGAAQDLYCHEECLRRALHPSVPLAV
jgi:hypothetical protein